MSPRPKRSDLDFSGIANELQAARTPAGAFQAKANQAVVALAGEVSSQEERDRAALAVQRREGVVRVQNRIYIESPSKDAAPAGGSTLATVGPAAPSS